MDNFDLWTKQNIIDIIFNFNEKNYELLRNFIKWYDIECNYMYILSTRYFYSIECMKLLLSTIDSFIDVKNIDVIEESDIDVKELENENDILEKTDDNNVEEVNKLENEIDIQEVNELEKKNDVKEVNELEKKNDNDEYVVINDDYYITKDIVKKQEIVQEIAEEIAENNEDVEAEDKDFDNTEAEEDNDDEDQDFDDNETEEDNDVEDEDDFVEDDNDNLIINEFSNNEIILLLNILQDDTKKFRKHNYIIGKCKEELFFYNNFYLGFTTGIFVFCLLKFL